MKYNKYLLSILPILIVLCSAALNGCGTDTTTNSATTGGWPPTFTFKPGATFVYSTDSLTAAGGSLPTHRISTDMVQNQTVISGQNCYPFLGATVDSNTHLSTPDLYYVRYDPAGYYYQYGIKRLIDTNQTPTWDLIGDFTKTRGTSYNVGTIDYTITLPPPYGALTFTGPLSGKIADSTTITVTGPSAQTIYCYRIELNANVSSTYSGQPVAASIFLDYYVGYTLAAYPNNPVGLVELKSRPFSFTFAGVPVLPEPGFDRKLYNSQ